MKNIISLMLLVGVVSCSQGSQEPKKRSAGGDVSNGQLQQQGKQQSGDAQQQAGGQQQQQTQPEVKKEEPKPQTTVSQDCKISEKFESIFGVVYIAAKTLIKDPDQRTLAALEVLKKVSSDISKLQTAASYDQFAKDIATLAKTQFSDMSNEQKIAVDVGLLAAVKLINSKCTTQSGDFSISDVVSFAKEIIKVLPPDVSQKLGGFDIDDIELLAKTLNIIQ